VGTRTGRQAKRKLRRTSCLRVETGDGLLHSAPWIDAIGVELRRVSFALIRVRETEELLRGRGGPKQYKPKVGCSLETVSEMLERTTFELRRAISGNQ
jgi:hypothetical protein